MNNKYLICIVGPTAIGKTALSLRLAREFNTEILSADSRQFFKEMSIGTAAPTPEELSVTPHHFVQHLSVEEPYSVGDFERDALVRLDELFQSRDTVVMVGGSGLYVNAVVQGLDEFPAVGQEIRKNLIELHASSGIGSLQQQLQELDPEYFAEVDLENPHRLIRALEICLGTGKTYSSFKNNKKVHRSFKSIFIGLTAAREIIYQRINKRVDVMMEQGLLQESRQLYPRRELNALNTVGYKELFNYFDGTCTLEEAVSEIKKNTRRFSKRQLTWFRKNTEMQWFDFETPPEDIIAFIKNILDGNHRSD